ncbi:MAG TPA: MBL fold metallo-hydrolase, partial [Acidimicrobiales bacterium]|nr:MBL fold metallo-hydrolase [Acidimicrobiales bacterium]
AASLVEAGGQQFLVDCGRGVLMRLAAAGSSMGQVAAVFLTHLHSDHITDFNDALTTHWISSFQPTPLRVIGPPGTQAFVDANLSMLTEDVGYRLAHHDDLTWSPDVRVTELVEGVAYEEGGVRVVAAPTDHRPVHPTVGFRFEHDGSSIVCAGDTVPCEGLDRLCEGADVYVQTVLRRSLVEQVPSPRFQEILDYHSSLQDAGETAARGAVGTLLLTHLIPSPVPGTEHEWVAEAAEHFDGRIVAAEDLTVVEA